MGRAQRAEEGTHLDAAGQRQGGKAEEWLQSLEGIVETCQLSCRRQGVLSGCCRLCGVCTPAAVVLLLVRGGAGTDRPLNESVWVSQLLATQSQRAGQGEPRKKGHRAQFGRLFRAVVAPKVGVTESGGAAVTRV